MALSYFGSLSKPQSYANNRVQGLYEEEAPPVAINMNSNSGGGTLPPVDCMQRNVSGDPRRGHTNLH